MISAPKNIYGPSVFEIFVHELGGAKRVANMLDVTERTIWRWLAEESAPKMACLALYWETRYGRSVIDSDHQSEVAILRGQIRLFEQQFVRAQRVIAGLKLLSYGTANEPYFDESGEFQSTKVQPNPNAPEIPTLDHQRPLGKRDLERKAKMLKRQQQAAG